jgi:hypothetical protein
MSSLNIKKETQKQNTISKEELDARAYLSTHEINKDFEKGLLECLKVKPENHIKFFVIFYFIK